MSARFKVRNRAGVPSFFDHGRISLRRHCLYPEVPFRSLASTFDFASVRIALFSALLEAFTLGLSSHFYEVI